MPAVASFKRILHVEDSETDAFIVKRGLRKVEGLVLDWVTTGREGLDKVRRGAYDLVLLDYALPDMTGLEVLVRLQEMPNAPPVVMVSGFGSEFVAVRGMSLGAIGYINKDTPEFKDSLAELLHQVHAEGEEMRNARANAERMRADPGVRHKMEQVLEDLVRSLAASPGAFIAGPEGFPLAVSAKRTETGRSSEPSLDVLAAMAAASVTRNLDVVGNAVGVGRMKGGIILHEGGSIVFHPVRGVGSLIVVLDRESAWPREGKELAEAAREIEALGVRAPA